MFFFFVGVKTNSPKFSGRLRFLWCMVCRVQASRAFHLRENVLQWKALDGRLLTLMDCKSNLGKSQVKPWSNELASRRKFKIWVYLRLRLARPCTHLRRLALPLVAIRFVRKLTRVFPPFCPRPKSTQVETRPLTYYWPMKYMIFLTCNGLFATCMY